MAYCTVADVQEYLGIDDTSFEHVLTDMVAAAQSAIDSHCHRTFEASADTTRYFDAVGTHIIARSLYIDAEDDLCAITTVTNGDGVVVASNEYTVYPRNETPYTEIRLLNSSGKYWTYSTDYENAISITGRWAYSTTAPAPIKQACISLAAFYYRQKDQPFVDVTAIEAGVVMRPVGIPAYIREMLKGFVRT